MKVFQRLCGPLLLLVFSSPLTVVSQTYPGWGWGASVNAVPSNGYLYCDAVDPSNGNVVDTVVGCHLATFQNQDGCVLYVRVDGSVHGLIYDNLLGRWADGLLSSNNSGSFANQDGVLCYLTDSGGLGVAVYDPRVHVWKNSILLQNGVAAFATEDGVVTYHTGSGSMGAAVYDPDPGSWQHRLLTYGDGVSMDVDEGVVAWTTTNQALWGAVYDLPLHQWEVSMIAGGGVIDYWDFHGVVGYMTSGGTVGGGVYDPGQNGWVNAAFAMDPVNGGLHVSNGTVHWENGSGPQKAGYQVSTGTWVVGQETELACRLYLVGVATMAPAVVHYSCWSVGANSYAYDSGAGHFVFRRWGWKQYDSNGSYQVELRVSHPGLNHFCHASVTVGPVATRMAAEEEAVKLYPNPVRSGEVLHLDLGAGSHTLRLVDMLGRDRWQSDGLSGVADVQTAGLSSGMYLLEIVNPHRVRSVRRVQVTGE